MSYSTTKEYRKEYYLKNRDNILLYVKEYRRRNRKKRKEYQDKWREENRAHIQEYDKTYRLQETPEQRKRRRMDCKIRGKRVKSGGKLLVSVVQLVYENNIKRYGTLTCVYCLEKIIFGNDTLDHKTPLSRNGKNNYENLVIACKSCNCKKHTKTYEEYITILRKGESNE